MKGVHEQDGGRYFVAGGQVHSWNIRPGRQRGQVRPPAIDRRGGSGISADPPPTSHMGRTHAFRTHGGYTHTVGWENLRSTSLQRTQGPAPAVTKDLVVASEAVGILTGSGPR